MDWTLVSADPGGAGVIFRPAAAVLVVLAVAHRLQRAGFHGARYSTHPDRAMEVVI